MNVTQLTSLVMERVSFPAGQMVKYVLSSHVQESYFTQSMMPTTMVLPHSYRLTTVKKSCQVAKKVKLEYGRLDVKHKSWKPP